MHARRMTVKHVLTAAHGWAAAAGGGEPAGGTVRAAPTLADPREHSRCRTGLSGVPITTLPTQQLNVIR